MVIVTYLFRRNPLSPHRLLFPDKQQGIFYIVTFPQTGQRIPQPWIDQLWTTGWNGKWPKLQMNPTCRLSRMITFSSHPQKILNKRPPLLLIFTWSIIYHAAKSIKHDHTFQVEFTYKLSLTICICLVLIHNPDIKTRQSSSTHW